MANPSFLQPPPPPLPPPSRVGVECFGVLRMFNSQEELDAYRAEPLWRRILGRTAYDRRLGSRPSRS